MDYYDLSFSDQIIAAFDFGLPLFTFKLKKEINEEKLAEAVSEALLKHPLYKSRLVFEDGLYKYAHNDLKPVIFHRTWNEPIKYGVKENNFFPWIVMWEKNEIHFTAAHSLSDGGGASRFIKSVLVSYLEKADGIKFSPNVDISVADAERTTELSSEKHLDESNQPMFVPKERDVIDTSPDIYENDISKISAYDISIKKSDIAHLAKESGTTTSAVLSSVLAIAYDKMLGVDEGNIKIEVPFDLRKFWNSVTDHNFDGMARLYYDIKKLKGKDFNLVQTAFRSQLDINMEISNQINNFNQEYKMKEMLKANPTMLEQMMKSLTDRLFLPKASIVLTHLGNLGYPQELLNEILDFKFTNRVFPGSMMAAVGFVHNEYVTLNMVQATKNDIYIDKIKETLEEHNIPYECEKIIPHGTVTFVAPQRIAK